ncbi:MAG TPA: TIGR04282 family arsenosugar biosynthesis glycosyltransferase [Candidatus Limnocylindria bacterium]|nr:TIGR04282 family arsenosugar biosynthesis glycosyltransferase [Candidatus Limnocylindria bacterium]
MAKHPTPGQVKSRLAATLGAETAADFQRAFVLDLAARLDAAGIAVWWAVWPPDAPFHDVVPGARVLPQEGADLGERMGGVARRLLAGGAGGVVLLGADVPHVHLAEVRAAVQALERGEVPVVLGPAADGGYYLLGLARLVPEIFRDVAWGRPDVRSVTEARLGALGVAYRLVADDFDVDEPADLRRLAERLRQGDLVLPHTAAVLARAGVS